MVTWLDTLALLLTHAVWDLVVCFVIEEPAAIGFAVLDAIVVTWVLEVSVLDAIVVTWVLEVAVN